MHICISKRHNAGFTLIELSLVLVIIGLLVGGVLVGRDLITASQIRAQISQFEKFQQAANTFKGKYGYLPGDIPDPDASRFGFKARNKTQAGGGNGDGLIEGVTGQGGTEGNGGWQAAGETVLFWQDLSKAGLIEGSFTSADATTVPASDVTGDNIALYLPRAKINNGFVYVYTTTYTNNNIQTIYGADGGNYWGLSGIKKLITSSFCCGYVDATKNLTVAAAYNIDQKMDDGLPQSGIVQAAYYNYSANVGARGYQLWANDASKAVDGLTTAATPASDTTCYDNGNLGGTVKYSMSYNSGSGVNCALAVKTKF